MALRDDQLRNAVAVFIAAGVVVSAGTVFASPWLVSQLVAVLGLLGLVAVALTDPPTPTPEAASPLPTMTGEPTENGVLGDSELDLDLIALLDWNELRKELGEP